MTAGAPTLCQSFRHLAQWTSKKLELADQLGVAFNEETITESILLKLSEQHTSSGLRIRSWTKTEEGGRKTKFPTGADWDLLFADRTGKNVTLRIQAKRLYRSGRYDGLDGGGKQIKDLRNNCGRAIPLYVFYNDVRYSRSFSDWRCLKSCDPRFRGESVWGCSFAPVTAIPSTRKPGPDMIRMEPWHCLVCQCPKKHASTSHLPQLILNAVSQAYRSTDSDGRFSEAPPLSFGLQTELPDWAVQLIGGDIEQALISHVRINRLRGVAVIQQFETY